MGDYRALQDGGNLHPEGPVKVGGLVCEGGSERRLLHSSHRDQSSAIPEIYARGEELPIHLPSLWPILCPPHLHQSTEASNDPSQVLGSQDNRLYRRYAGPGRISGSSISAPGNPAVGTPGSGLHYQLGEVRSNANPADRILGSGNQLQLNGAQPPGGETEADQRRGPQNPLSTSDVCQDPVSANWETEHSCPGSGSGSPILPPTPRQLEKRPCLWQPWLRQCDNSVSRSSGGAYLVAAASRDMEWQMPLLKGRERVIIRSDASLLGWGATCEGIQTGGLWSELEKMWHINCLEMQAAALATQTFLKGRTGLSVLLQMDNTTAVAYVNNLGGTVSPQLTTLAKTLWMWALQRDITLTAQHIPGVSNIVADTESRTVRDRTDWKLSPEIFSQINQIFGPLEVDLFASRLTHQLPRYFSWRPDPLAEATDAFRQDWVCQPTLVPYGESSESSDGTGSPDRPSGSSVEGSTLVPSPSESIVGVPSTDPLTSRPDSEPLRTGAAGTDAPASRVAYLREKFNDSSLSEEASSLLLASWRSKSSQSYDSHFRKWLSWCAQQGSNPVSGPVAEVANFLAHLFNKDINLAHSMLTGLLSLQSTTG